MLLRSVLVTALTGHRGVSSLGGALCFLLSAIQVAASTFGLPAEATLVESGWNRIELEVRFEHEPDNRRAKTRECYLALPPRKHTLVVTDPVCAVLDRSGRLLKDGYVPTAEEVDDTHLRSVAILTSGFCHDRFLARLEFQPYLGPLTDTSGGDIFSLRRLRVSIEFEGEVLPGYEPIPEDERKDPLGFERLFESILLNHESSNAYRVRETKPLEKGEEFYEAVREALSSGGVWKFPVTGKGIHRIDGTLLTSVGMDLTQTPARSVRLWQNGEQVPYFLHPEPDGEMLSPECSLFFYDSGEGTDYSAERFYWVTSAGVHARLLPEIIAQCTSEAAVYSSFSEQQSLGKLSVMPRGQLPFCGTWFRDIIVGTRPHTYSFDVPNATGETVDFHVGFRNGLSEDLLVVARVNDASAASIRVETRAGSKGPVELDFSVPRDQVQESGNVLSLQIVNEHRPPPAGIHYGLYVEDLQVSHHKRPQAIGDRLTLNLPEEATGCIEVIPEGLDDRETLVFQVEPRFRVAAGCPRNVSEGIVFPAEKGSSYELLQPSATLTVEGLTRFNGFTVRREDIRGNYVVIGPREFEDPLSPLLEFRRRQGYAVNFLDIQALFDEFSFGVPDPHAIRDFVRYSLSRWNHPVPSHILLAGDAFWDYRNRTESPFLNLVPTYIPINRLDSAASDIWFARAIAESSPNTSDLPDVFLARIPARDGDEAALAAEKFIAYENESELGPWRGRVLLASDHQFEQSSEAVVEDTIPKYVAPSYFNYADYPLEDHYRIQILRPETKGHTKTGPKATAALVRSINEGALLWDYFGHGGAFVLSNSDLFIGNDRYDTDVLRLGNRRKLPMFTSLSCLTGLFYLNSPWAYSLGESLLFSPDGAIATYTPCDYGSQPAEEHLSKRLKGGVFNIPNARAGDAVAYAQISSTLSGGVDHIVSQFIFCGDPVTRLAVPAEKIDVHVASQEADEQGRQLKLTLASAKVPWGTAAMTLYDLERRTPLWASERTAFSASAKGIDLLLPGFKATDEGILQVYVWNQALESDAVGWTYVPALRPNVIVVENLCALRINGEILEGVIVLENQTAREEKEILVSGFVDDRLVFTESVDSLGPRKKVFQTVRMAADTGMHEALFVVRSKVGEMDRYLFSFAVPDPTRSPLPVILPGTFDVKVSSSVLAKGLNDGDPFPPGVKAELTASVVNPSATESAGCSLLFLSESEPSPEPVEIPILSPGEKYSASSRWTVPPPGEYALKAVLRSSSEPEAPLLESVEKTITVGDYPDLAFAEDGLQAEPETAIEGESIRFFLRFLNGGETPTGEFTLKLLETKPDGNEVILQNLASSVPAIQWPRLDRPLSAGESAELSILWHPSGNVGPHLFVAVLDDGNQIPEENETNNRQTLELEFSPGLNRLREARNEAWVLMESDKALEINGEISDLLDSQLERFDGDRTWLDFDWFAQRAFCALVSSDFERCAEVLDWGIELLPTYGANYYLKACLELRRGRLAEAKRNLALIQEEKTFDFYWKGWLGSNDPFFQAAEESLGKGDPATARRLLEKCVEQTPVNYDAWWLLHEVHLQQGEYRRALAALHRYVDARPPSLDNGVLWYEAMYWTLTFGLNEPRKAREVVAEAMSLYPGETRFHFLVPYLDYLEGYPASEIRERLQNMLSQMRTHRGITASSYLLLTRLDLDLDDLESLGEHYADFILHSSKTSVKSGLRAWPRVTPSKMETNPELRVFAEPESATGANENLAFLLDKSKEREPKQLPEATPVELPAAFTLDLGSPRTIDACLISADDIRLDRLKATIFVSPDNGEKRKELGKGVPLPTGRGLAIRFPAVSSRFWHVNFASTSGDEILRLRDLSLMEVIPERSSSSEP